MKRIPLSARSHPPTAHAVVDDDDYEALTALGPWYAIGRPDCIYARRADVGLMHRYLLGLPIGDSRCGDHIDGNTLNNQRANLRIVTAADNSQNRGAGHGRSPFRGVNWNPSSNGAWEARAMVNGKRTYIGRFKTEFDAAVAVDEFRLEHMPFARRDPALGMWLDDPDEAA